MTNSDSTNTNAKGRNFRIDFQTTSGTELSRYIRQIRITNSIYTVWPQISIDLAIDNNDIIKNHVYGQETFILTIVIFGEGNEPLDRIDIPLLYLQSNLSLIVKLIDSQDNQLDFTPVSLSTIPLYSMNFMGCFVNTIQQEDSNPSMNPIEFLKSILEEKNLKSYEIDNKGRNEDLIEQIIIPPMSMRQTIDYIHEHFQFYNGPLFRYVNFKGKFFMWDMSKRINNTSKLQIHQLASGMNNAKVSEDLIDNTFDGVNFVTRDPVFSLYHGNSNIVRSGNDNLYITHPSSKLYHLFSSNITDIVEDYGISKTLPKQIMKNKFLNVRKRYFHDTSGNDYQKSVLTSSISESIKKVTTIRTILRRNIMITKSGSNDIFPVLSVGEPVEFIPTTKEYLIYSGYYILETSDYVISRQSTDNFDAYCKLTMTRSSHNYSNLE